MSAPLLQLRGVSKRFGGVQALKEIDLLGLAGQVHGVIGPNGAGKSTLIGCITGVNRIDTGEIRFGDQRIEGLSAFRRARCGISRTFQKIRLAQDLTVYENVASGLAGRRLSQRGGLFSLMTPVSSASIDRPVREAMAATGVSELADETVAGLPYGKRHFVELARVLVAKPAVILLDEPATGLTDSDRERLKVLVRQMAAEGALVILVEHDLDLVGRLCDVVTVVEYGQRIFNGTPADAQEDERVVRAYLGANKLHRQEDRRVASA